jgi:hypothetical protein
MARIIHGYGLLPDPCRIAAIIYGDFGPRPCAEIIYLSPLANDENKARPASPVSPVSPHCERPVCVTSAQLIIIDASPLSAHRLPKSIPGLTS